MKEHTNRTLNQIGEKLFLSKLANLVDTPILDYNEDASTFALESGKILVINADMLVFQTDVLPGMSDKQIGQKAVTMSVSDIVAKGTKPLGCLASIGFPSNLEISRAMDVIQGIRDQCTEYDILYLGGDLNETADIIVDIVSFGVCEREKLLPRKGANNGDLLFSTGFFGLTSLGYNLLLNNQKVPVDLHEIVLSSIFEPKAKIEYLDLFSKISINTCMDSSDGLFITLKELSDINKMGIDVTKVPIHSQVESYANTKKLNPLDLTFNGGEEFELIFSIIPEMEEELLKQAKERKLFVRKIGCFNKNHKKIIISEQKFSMYNLSNKGFEHFKTRDIH